MSDCPLCIREPIRPVLYENEKWWLTICMSCGVSMIVLKEHRATVSYRERGQAERIARQYTLDRGLTVRGLRTFRYDDEMRTITDHYHGHLRHVDEE